MTSRRRTVARVVVALSFFRVPAASAIPAACQNLSCEESKKEAKTYRDYVADLKREQNMSDPKIKKLADDSSKAASECEAKSTSCGGAGGGGSPDEATTQALQNAKELGRIVGDAATKSIENAGKDMDEIRFKSSGSKEKAAALARKDQSTDLDGDTSEDAVVIGPLVVKWVAAPAAGSASSPAKNPSSTAACTRWKGVYNLFTNMTGDFQMDIWSLETSLSVPETWADIANQFATGITPPSARRWREQAADFATYRAWYSVVSGACVGPKMSMVGKCGPMPAALDLNAVTAACTNPASTAAACTAALTANMAAADALSSNFNCVTGYVADYK